MNIGAPTDRIVRGSTASEVEGKIAPMGIEGQSGARLRPLLEGALEAWRLQEVARLAAAPEGVVRIDMADGTAVTVTAIGDPGDPDRWQVEVVRPPLEPDQAPRRRLTLHAGSPGMLRAVRAALDPGHRPARMIVTPGGSAEGA